MTDLLAVDEEVVVAEGEPAFFEVVVCWVIVERHLGY